MAIIPHNIRILYNNYISRQVVVPMSHETSIFWTHSSTGSNVSHTSVP
jgi:hypothetical protein